MYKSIFYTAENKPKGCCNFDIIIFEPYILLFYIIIFEPYKLLLI